MRATDSLLNRSPAAGRVRLGLLFLLLSPALDLRASASAFRLPTSELCEGYDAANSYLPSQALALATLLGGIDASSICAEYAATRRTRGLESSTTQINSPSTASTASADSTSSTAPTTSTYFSSASSPISTSSSATLGKPALSALDAAAPLTTTPALVVSPPSPLTGVPNTISRTSSTHNSSPSSSIVSSSRTLSRRDTLVLTGCLAVALPLICAVCILLLMRRRAKRRNAAHRRSHQYLLRSSFQPGEKPFYATTSSIQSGDKIESGEDNRSGGRDVWIPPPVPPCALTSPPPKFVDINAPRGGSAGMLATHQRISSRGREGDVLGTDGSGTTKIRRLYTSLRRSHHLSGTSSTSPFGGDWHERSPSPLQDDAATIRWDPLPPLPPNAGRHPSTSSLTTPPVLLPPHSFLSRQQSAQPSIGSTHSSHYYFLHSSGGVNGAGCLRAVNGVDGDALSFDNDDDPSDSIDHQEAMIQYYSSLDYYHPCVMPFDDDPTTVSSPTSPISPFDLRVQQLDISSASPLAAAFYSPYHDGYHGFDDDTDELSLHRPASGRAIEIVGRKQSAGTMSVVTKSTLRGDRGGSIGSNPFADEEAVIER